MAEDSATLREVILEIQVNATMGRHDLGPLEPVDNPAGLLGRSTTVPAEEPVAVCQCGAVVTPITATAKISPRQV